VTHWDGGLGACGTNVDTSVNLAIALPFAFVGTLSNSNPYCGRGVTLYNPTSGTTVQATVKDKCMGCINRAIDCTDILFNQITDGQGNGRIPRNGAMLPRNAGLVPGNVLDIKVYA
jgi:hypothetical protein